MSLLDLMISHKTEKHLRTLLQLGTKLWGWSYRPEVLASSCWLPCSGLLPLWLSHQEGLARTSALCQALPWISPREGRC